MVYIDCLTGQDYVCYVKHRCQRDCVYFISYGSTCEVYGGAEILVDYDLGSFCDGCEGNS